MASRLIAQDKYPGVMSRDIWTPEIFVPPERIFQVLLPPLKYRFPRLWGVCASMSAVPGTGLGANKIAHWSARCHYIPQDEFGRRKLCAAGRRS